MPAKTGKKGSKKQIVRFTVDCSQPVEDSVLEPASFEKFLRDAIKVNGKAGNLGDTVKVDRDKTKVTVTAELPFAKRYLKYLTKKFLKRQQLRDYLHVIATNKVVCRSVYHSYLDEGGIGSNIAAAGARLRETIVQREAMPVRNQRRN